MEHSWPSGQVHHTQYGDCRSARQRVHRLENTARQSTRRALLGAPLLPGSELEAKGFVKFREAPQGRGTVLEARIRYWIPGGALGRAVSKALGKDPGFMMRQDLRRFKALIETGEVPTTEGQTHGPRSLLTGVARVINPDQPIRRDVSVGEVIEEQRRVS